MNLVTTNIATMDIIIHLEDEQTHKLEYTNNKQTKTQRHY
ncbi:hypothetical protein APA_2706 [Pseudanabaena sp. lw0831]|nr:hypothetical protein APA_2706 [Pseudanabaena sp. lw0831]